MSSRKLPIDKNGYSRPELVLWSRLPASTLFESSPVLTTGNRVVSDSTHDRALVDQLPVVFAAQQLTVKQAATGNAQSHEEPNTLIPRGRFRGGAGFGQEDRHREKASSDRGTTAKEASTCCQSIHPPCRPGDLVCFAACILSIRLHVEHIAEFSRGTAAPSHVIETSFLCPVYCGTPLRYDIEHRIRHLDLLRGLQMLGFISLE